MTDETPKDKRGAVPPRRVQRRKVVWHGLRVAWWLALIPVLFALVAGAAMLDRDITAPSWVVARVEARAGEVLAGGEIAFGDMKMRIGTDLHPTVRLSDAVLRDASGQTLVRVSSMSGLLSPRGLLFDRTALVQEVRLSGIEVALRRARNGALAVAFDAPGAAAPDRELADVLRQIDTAFERPALAALEQVDLDGIVINFSDARAGRTWTADGGRAILDVRGGQTTLVAQMAVLSGGSVASMAFDYFSPRGSLDSSIRFALEDLPARDLASQSPALSWLAALEAPLTAEISTGTDETGALLPLEAGLRIGRGALSAGRGTAPFAFEAASADLRYDPLSQHLTFEDITLTSDWGTLRGRGQAFAPEATVEGALPQSLIGQVRFPDLRLNPLGLYPQAVAFGDLDLDLRLGLDPFQVEVGQAVLAHESGTLVLSGEAAAEAAGWTVAVDLAADRIDRARLFALWPEGLSPGMRGWFGANLTAARVTELRAGLRQTPETAPRVAAHFAFDQTDLKIFRKIEPVRNGRGFASLTDNRFVVTLAEGGVAAPRGGTLDMSGSTMVIPDVRIGNPPMTLDLAMGGTITAALSILDQPPFRLMERVRLPATLADGRAQSRVRLAFPLKNPVPPDELSYDVVAEIARAETGTLMRGRTLVGRGLRLEADNAQLQISGPVTLDGVPMRGRWTQVMGQPKSQVAAQMELSPQVLDAFGVSLPRGAVSGRGQGELLVDLQRGSPPAFRLTSDLDGLTLQLPQIGWVKGSGQRGALVVAGALGERARIDTLDISGGGLSAQGAIELNDSGGLSAARFERVRVGTWLDAPVTLRGRGAGRPVGVEIGGGVLDLRQAQLGGGGGGEGGPLAVTLNRLQVTEGIALRGFRGEFTSVGGLSGNFSARVNDGPGIRGTLAPRDGRTAVRVQADDAGGVVRAAGLLKNGVGGALDLTLLPAAGQGSFDGFLNIQQIRVRDAPAIAALLDAISVVGLLQQLDGQGLSFEEVEARFRLTPNQVIVTEASAVGPGLGISIDGIYTLASKSFDMQGVVSPFYLLNGIGSILTRRGEGLIGFAYTINGTAEAPEVSVNPLSAFTPGMFREIFRRPPPELSQ